jgi:hypothetical protein
MRVAPIGVGHTSGKRAIQYWEPADPAGTTGASRPCLLNMVTASTRDSRAPLLATATLQDTSKPGSASRFQRHALRTRDLTGWPGRLARMVDVWCV